MRRREKAAPAAAPAVQADPDFLTFNEAAARLRFSVKSLRRRIADGLIRATPEGGRRLIAIDDFYAYRERLRRDARCRPSAPKRPRV